MSRLRCWCEGDNVTVYAKIGNLSEGGIFLRTSTPLDRGARAVLKFSGLPTMETSARIVWTRIEGQGGPPGMGLAFEKVDEGVVNAIRQLMQNESPEQKQTSDH
jgi:uncharacterized protein (TIGR02266 family)